LDGVFVRNIALLKKKEMKKKEVCSVRKGRSGHFGQGEVWNAYKGVLFSGLEQILAD
jgi:hypothetical protein